MIASGMNRNGMPLLPVTRYVAAWPPATAVSGAGAATMKNTRSGTPSARRCNCPLAALPLAADGDGAAAGSMTDMGGLSSLGRRPRRLVMCSPAPIQDEVGQHGGHLGHGRHRHPLVDAVDVLGPRAEADRRDAAAHEVARIRRGR